MIEQPDKTQRNCAVDLLKFILAGLVVFIHVPFDGESGEIIKTVARVAVPCFFMISGFFCYGKSRTDVIRQIRKITLLAVYSVLVYFVVCCLVLCCYQGHDFRVVFSDISPGRLVKMLLVQAVPSTLGGHLWYLLALIYAYVFIACIIGSKFFDKISLLLVMLLCVTLMFSEILPGFGVIQYHATLYRNVYLTGIPFIMLGYRIHKFMLSRKISSGVILGIFAGR